MDKKEVTIVEIFWN